MFRYEEIERKAKWGNKGFALPIGEENLREKLLYILNKTNPSNIERFGRIGRKTHASSLSSFPLPPFAFPYPTFQKYYPNLVLLNFN